MSLRHGMAAARSMNARTYITPICARHNLLSQLPALKNLSIIHYLYNNLHCKSTRKFNFSSKFAAGIFLLHFSCKLDSVIFIFSIIYRIKNVYFILVCFCTYIIKKFTILKIVLTKSFGYNCTLSAWQSWQGSFAL